MMSEPGSKGIHWAEILGNFLELDIFYHTKILDQSEDPMRTFSVKSIILTSIDFTTFLT